MNTVVHVEDAEADPRTRAFSLAELADLFDYADDQIAATRAARRNPDCQRSAVRRPLKAAYRFGLRCAGTAMLDLADYFGLNPHAPLGPLRLVRQDLAPAWSS